MNRTILGFVLGCGFFFSYGVVVGKYQLFPYQSIASTKKIITNEQLVGFQPSYRYQHKKNFFELNSEATFDWVFVGDSMVEGSEWHELFTQVRVANRGLGGDITAALLTRLDTVINTGAKTAFLMIGVNDIAWGFEVKDIAKRHSEIVTKLQNAGIDVVVHAVLYTDGIKANNGKIKQLNALLADYCSQHHIKFLDLNPALAPNGVLTNAFSFDGIHLNGVGYQIWAQQLRKLISE